jgi:translation initiation factor IF-2
LNYITFYPQLTLDTTIHNPSWFYLKNPKLILNPNNIIFTPVSTVQPVQQLESMITESKENNLLLRTDKKNKYQYKAMDILDVKKTKNKTKKKLRTKIHLGDEEDTINNSYIDSTPNHEGIELSLVRPVKPWKKKTSLNKLITNTNEKHKNSTKKLNHNTINKSYDIDDHHNIKDKKIQLSHPISIQELSSIIEIPETEIIKWLFLQSISVTINQIIDTSLAQSIAKHYGFIIENKDASENISSLYDTYNNSYEKEYLEPRHPIVTILGHVNHGKTTLLDTICQTNNAHYEPGGITQAIATYEIEIDHTLKQKIILLDTPGHEAFADMRLRCAQIADIVILVIAADDSLQPQTIEAIHCIQNNKRDFIVVINKIDKPGVNILKVKEDLTDYNIVGKDWGGNINIIEVSALANKNVNFLLETILELAKIKKLQANPYINAEGTILDAYLDKTKGPVAKVLITNGKMHIGDFIIVDGFISKIRAMIDNKQNKLNIAGPSSIIKLWGLSNIPMSGSLFTSQSYDKQAKKILLNNINTNKLSINFTNKLHKRVTLDKLKKTKNLVTKQVNIIIKIDSHGSIDAIIQACARIPQEKVQLNLIAINVGEIIESDLQLAIASKATIAGFNINLTNHIKNVSEKLGITIRIFNIIYNLLDYIQEKMLDLVSLEYKEYIIGSATVETIFELSKGSVAGCIVQSGRLKQKAYIRIYRNQIVIYDGKLNSLKRLKEDVIEVKSGNDCGILIDTFAEWQKNDKIEAYELIPAAKTL